MRPSHQTALLLGLLPIVFMLVEIARADQFEEMYKEQIGFLRAKLDDRLLPSRTAKAQTNLSQLTKLEADAKAAVKANPVVSDRRRDLLTATDRELNGVSVRFLH